MPANAYGMVVEGALKQAVARGGGRVLAITALGADRAEARALAYAAIRKIRWHGGFYRRDIAQG